eukprot:TRINITY_DN1420_c0_g1_i2.p1 TRINITY_DN1420_c0_g1~~TRINITY_DN1420_c0_g1_i2.p1  ORF type:complete len:313 (+),score=50.43 TRINITY_DN1420_c0_g1_i2:105-1043(+)
MCIRDSSSFVRQLNIYGFRKVNSESWEFSNPSFQRGNPGRLREIKRRKTAAKDEKETEDTGRPPMPLGFLGQKSTANEQAYTIGLTRNQENALLDNQQSLINEVCRLRQEQESMQRMVAATLNELHETRCHQHRTQQTVEKIMGFLSGVLQSNVSSIGGGSSLGKRKLPQYLEAQQQGAQCSERPPEGWASPAGEDSIGDMLLEIMSMDDPLLRPPLTDSPRPVCTQSASQFTPLASPLITAHKPSSDHVASLGEEVGLLADPLLPTPPELPPPMTHVPLGHDQPPAVKPPALGQLESPPATAPAGAEYELL